MWEEFTRLEGTLLQVKDEQTRIILFKEIQELKVCVEKLQTHYRKVLGPR
jgi:hypothetical protein